jgi:carbonic anhydrase/acetyltransferase-like protein (isoleucine patch superfamily)
VDDAAFVATGAMVFNGARVGRASSLALGVVVHIGCRVPPGTRIPIDWVAVGDPAELQSPHHVEEIRGGLAAAGGFLPYSVAADRPREEMMRSALDRYTRALGRHRAIQEIGDGPADR